MSRSIDFGYLHPYNFRGFVGRPAALPYKATETRSSLKGPAVHLDYEDKWK